VPVNSVFMENGSGDEAIQEIEFELWKRHYYPNIREQLIGKVRLDIITHIFIFFANRVPKVLKPLKKLLNIIISADVLYVSPKSVFPCNLFLKE